MILDRVNSPSDLKKLNLEEKKELADDIRNKIINTVSKRGGHLASNLGVVELTIALHDVFNTPKDKIVWDVGHQTYVHKILTGRKNRMDTLRTFKGISGFPKISESEYDCFNTGHSSTSISVALGMARARDIQKKDNKVIAVIGDGALTGGMALEALNDAGSSKSNIIVVLNDNEMSISKNIGGISRLLTHLRTRKFYQKSNLSIKNLIQKVPILGSHIVKFIQKLKRGIKQLIIPEMYFEDIGFRYLGPVDGHNIEQLENILNISKSLDGPVLIHVITKKGKGYKPAEERPDEFHSTSKFCIETGEKASKEKDDYSNIFGKKLVKLASKNEKIVAITAAMKDGTGLKEFAAKYPKRFFDVGIAEEHAVALAAGMAKEGLIPVVPIYSTFLQRSYDQIMHDVALQKLHVIFCIDRAGIVGNDGETHQGIYDLSYLNTIPNMNILAPKNFEELEKMLEYAIKSKRPIAIRYPRGSEELNFELEIDEKNKNNKIKYGKAEYLIEGNDITIVAIGKMVKRAWKIAKRLQELNYSVELINARFLKPLDKNKIITSINKTKNIITIEDNIENNGLGSCIKNLIINEKLEKINVKTFSYPNEFIKHGTVEEIEKLYGLDEDSIFECAKEMLKDRYKDKNNIIKIYDERQYRKESVK